MANIGEISDVILAFPTLEEQVAMSLLSELKSASKQASSNFYKTITDQAEDVFDDIDLCGRTINYRHPITNRPLSEIYMGENASLSIDTYRLERLKEIDAHWPDLKPHVEVYMEYYATKDRYALAAEQARQSPYKALQKEGWSAPEEGIEIASRWLPIEKVHNTLYALSLGNGYLINGAFRFNNLKNIPQAAAAGVFHNLVDPVLERKGILALTTDGKAALHKLTELHGKPAWQIEAENSEQRPVLPVSKREIL